MQYMHFIIDLRKLLKIVFKQNDLLPKIKEDESTMATKEIKVKESLSVFGKIKVLCERKCFLK